LICGLLKDRLEELYALVVKGIEETGLSMHQSSGIVLTGGSAKLPGVAELASSYLGIPARVGLPYAYVNGQRLNDPAYASSVGTLLWFANQDMGKAYVNSYSGSYQSQLKSKFRGWIREILPV
jgi:cell division protein FtsA